MGSTTIAAMKSKIGNTEYYVLSMKAHELARSVTFPAELEGWDDLSLEERDQRDLNYNRVKKHIAPYMAGNQDRFWGSVILAAQGFKPQFESIPEIAQAGMTNQYKTQAQMMGFLTLNGNEVLIPLDGQHRIKALHFAISGRDEHGKEIKGMKPDLSIADDDVVVILVPYTVDKARRIFTKVNRYAKPTTTGQNLVTDDDDVVPVVAREVANTIIGSDLVKYKSNSLTAKEGYFTTLSAVAESSLAVLEIAFDIQRRDRIEDVGNEEKMSMYTRKACSTWKFLVDNIDIFAQALANKSAEKDSPGERVRKDLRENTLLLQPVPQICLVTAYAKLINGREWKLPPADAAAKLNAVEWGKGSKFWDRVLMSGGKIITKNRSLVTDLLCYVAGKPMDEAKLLKEFRACFPPAEQKKAKLPEKSK